MPVAYQHLAFLERARGDLTAAVAALRRAVALRPDDTETLALLGVYLGEAGHAREAAALLEPLAARPHPDLDVLTARGMALAALGRRDEALATFRTARTAYPSSAMVPVNIGTVQL